MSSSAHCMLAVQSRLYLAPTIHVRALNGGHVLVPVVLVVVVIVVVVVVVVVIVVYVADDVDDGVEEGHCKREEGQLGVGVAFPK